LPLIDMRAATVQTVGASPSAAGVPVGPLKPGQPCVSIELVLWQKGEERLLQKFWVSWLLLLVLSMGPCSQASAALRRCGALARAQRALQTAVLAVLAAAAGAPVVPCLPCT
jgi:hypothetical protein